MTERERVAQALRWLGIATLLYPLGRAVVDPTFALLGRPTPGVLSRAVVALYLAIPLAAITLARRTFVLRARNLLHAGAFLSLLGLGLEWAPVRFESFVGALFSFANDATINAGVAVLALAVMALDVKDGTFARRSTTVLEGSIALSVGILVEVAWTRLRPSPPDQSKGIYVLGQIVFVTPLLLLALGAFVRAHLIRDERGASAALAKVVPGRMRWVTLVAVAVAAALLAVGDVFSTARLVWTLGGTAAFALIAVRTSRQS